MNRRTHPAQHAGSWHRVVLLGFAATALLGARGSGCNPPEPEEPVCAADTDCEIGTVCNAAGACEVVVCPDLWMPVCGADGRTYSSRCSARAAHVEVAARRRCATPCGGGLNACAPEARCVRAVGECDDAAIGYCAPRPEACADLWAPVCGCDGRTYSNACFAASAGVGVAAEGECPRPAACRADPDCDEGRFCQTDDGRCGGVGTCVDRPAGCSREYAPVCGCDGETYGNACVAAAAGANVAHPGACQVADEPCGDHETCGDGRYCARRAGACGGIGACAPRPEVCAEIFQPVCGCDGETYGNACVAASAGVNVDAEGACPEPACRADDDCARGEYCSRPEGECGGAGTCAEQPFECRDVDEPVCGCDGETYANACDAAAAGVSVAARGRCRPEDGVCRTAADCPADALCARPEGACGSHGECVARPDLCPQDALPVCGCDGQSYGNRCMAAVAGVSVAYAGRCDPPDGACADTADCAEDELCARAACAGEGVCQPRPDGCAAVYEPVCGCDGRTWGNACRAAAAGVGVTHGGACEAEACEHNADCGNARFCARAAGVCDGAGVCEPRPQVCPDVWLPVCGCDGETYGNECEAAAAGRTVRARGECEVDEARCERHGECEDGRYCARPEGRCEGPGVCQDRPQLCDEVRDPVCGCDGETRPNDCFAARDGANVRHRGRCDFDGCAHDADCGVGEICRLEDGMCGGIGACEPRPMDCPAVVEPVCACDGVTYGNACDALAEGQSVAHAGPCPAPGCATNADCGRGEYCERPAGACDVPGECQPWPAVRCVNVDEPVCGCDGVDYMNACIAAGAGMTVDHVGRCGAEEVVCESDVDCGRRGRCFTAPGVCDGPGVCAPPPPPGECGDLMRPVCGCDEETYLNACRARAAGVSIDGEGACP